MRHAKGQEGNIFTMLLGGIMLSGALSVVLYQTMGGPVAASLNLARGATASAQAQTAARTIIAQVSALPVSADTGIAGDCDNDGFVEPAAWRAAGTAPVDGGLVPLTVGAGVTDPWNTDYGYCVWDVGPFNDPAADNGCGASARRLRGTPAPLSGAAATQTVLAVVSAGPDRAFQTTCGAYNPLNPTADLVTTALGSDDTVVRYAYAEASSATAALWGLKQGDPATATTSKDIVVGDAATTGTVSAASLKTVGKVKAGGAVVLGTQSEVSVCDPGHAGLVRYNDGAGTVPAVVQSTPMVTQSGMTDGGTSTATFPSLPKVGDTIVVVVSGAGSGAPFALAANAVTDNQGGDAYTQIGATQGVGACNNGLAVYFRTITAVPGGRAFTVSITPLEVSEVSWTAFELSGLLPSGQVDDATDAQLLATASQTSTAVTGAGTGDQANELAMSAIGGRCSAEANVNYAKAAEWTQDLTRWTQNDTSGTPGLAVAIRSLTDAATSPPAHTWAHTAEPVAADSQDAAMIATFRSAAAGSTAGLEYCNGTAWTAVGTGGSGSPWENGGGADELSELDAIPDAKTEYLNSHLLGLGQGALSAASTTGSGTAISVVHSAQDQASNVAAATGLSVPLPGDSTTGNAIIVVLAAQTAANNTAMNIPLGTDSTNASIVDNVGNTYTRAGADFTSRCSIAGADRPTGKTAIYYVNGAGGNSFTAPPPGTPLEVTVKVSAAANLSVGVMEVSGLDPADAAQRAQNLDQGATGATTAATSTGTLGQNYALVVAGAAFCDADPAAAFSYNTATPSGAGNWTEVMNDDTSSTGTSGHVGNSFVYSIATAANGTTPGYTFNLGGTTDRHSPYSIASFYGTSTNPPTIPVYYDTAAGMNALAAEATGARNTAMGYQAAATQTTALDNTALGSGALDAATTGVGQNIAVGSNALGAATTGTYNVGVGSGAVPALTTGSYVTGIGAQALNSYTQASTSSVHPLAIGAEALFSKLNTCLPVAIGYQALRSDTTSNFQVGIGTQAARGVTSNTTTAVGYRALYTGGGTSVAVGSGALTLNTGTGGLVAFGAQALTDNTTGTENTAFGYNALADSQTDTGQTAFGSSALLLSRKAGATAGQTAVGADALAANTTGMWNTAFGAGALGANTGAGGVATAPPSAGNGNFAFGTQALGAGPLPAGATAVGYQALLNDSALGNTGIGYQALMSNVSGTENTAIGFQALFNNTASFNTAVGAFALFSNTTGHDNTAVGFEALFSNLSGNENTATGYQAMRANTGSRNTAMGYQALMNGTSGNDNTALGYQSLRGSTGMDGSDNTAMGAQALYSNLHGNENTAAGVQALYSNTDGDGNTAAGIQALYSNTTGMYNAAAGYRALYANADGSANTGFGANALKSAVNDSNNTAIGWSALRHSNTGAVTDANNTAFGFNALSWNVTGTNNTAAGTNALVANGRGGADGNIAVVQTMPLQSGAGLVTSSQSFSTLPAAGNTIIVTISDANIVVTDENGFTDMSPVSGVTDNQGNTYTQVVASTYSSIYNGTYDGVRTYIYAAYDIPAPSGTFTLTLHPSNAVLDGGTAVGNTMQWGALEVSGLEAPVRKTAAIAGVGGVPNATGTWPVIVVDPMHADLEGSTWAGAYTSGGTLTPTDGSGARPVTGAANNGSGAIRLTLSSTGGLDGQDPLDQVGTNLNAAPRIATTATTVRTGGPMAQPDELAISLIGLYATTGAGTCDIASASAGWTEVYNDDQCNADYSMTGGRGTGFGMAYKILSEIGTVPHDWTHKAAEEGAVGVIATFKGARQVSPGSGSDNTAAGAFALANNTTGSNNTALGSRALYNNVTGSDNTAVGYLAGPVGGGVSSNVTGAVSGTGGAVRLTVPSVAAHFAPRDNIVVSGVGGVAGANGTWSVRWVDSTHIDLIGATGSGTYTSGGTASVGGNTVAVTDAVVGMVLVQACGTGAGTTTENGNVTVTCASGTIQQVDFASFGTPAGTCGAYTTGACHMGSSATTVSAACFGQVSCTVNASTAVFGDPCGGTPKYLYIQAGCGNGPTAGVVRLTLATPYALATGISVVVSDMAAAGVTGADGTRTVTAVDDTHIELQGTTFGGTYTSGGAVCVGSCGALNNTTAIGYNAQVFSSNTVRFGDTNVTSIGGSVAWTAASDRRLKENIEESDLGLSFLMGLRPVSFRLVRGDEKLHYGFIAQDVQAALGGKETNIAVQEADPMGTWRLRTSDLLAPAVKAVQEQQAVEDRQKEEIAALKARLSKLKEKLKTRKGGQP